MRRAPLPILVLTVTLALILPLEQAHCAWMGWQWHAAPLAATTTSGHACCTPHAAAGRNQQAQPQKPARACVCPQIPAGSLPQASLVGTAAPSVTAFTEHSAPSGSEPVLAVRETVPSLDVGSPPLPHEPGAHGLRAPPAGA